MPRFVVGVASAETGEESLQQVDATDAESARAVANASGWLVRSCEPVAVGGTTVASGSTPPLARVRLDVDDLKFLAREIARETHSDRRVPGFRYFFGCVWRISLAIYAFALLWGVIFLVLALIFGALKGSQVRF